MHQVCKVCRLSPSVELRPGSSDSDWNTLAMKCPACGFYTWPDPKFRHAERMFRKKQRRKEDSEGYAMLDKGMQNG